MLSRSVRVVMLLGTLAGATTLASAQEKGKGWSVPKCREIAGTAAVTYTKDDGATLTPTKLTLRGTRYTLGVATSDRANTLWAVQDRTLLRSTSAGCRWDAVAFIEVPTGSDGYALTLTPAPGDRAWAWADGRPDLSRIDGTTVTAIKAPANVVGVGADPVNGNRARVGDDTGRIWETTDGGLTWAPLGEPAVYGEIVYRAAFDPANPDHVLFGTTRAGVSMTFNGGRSWEKVGSLSATGGPVNAFNVIVSPANGSVVYVQGLDLDESDAGAPNQGRHIWRSVDGGLSWASVAEEDAANEFYMPNGAVLAAHPSNPDVLYWLFGTKSFDYGTDIYKLDVAAGAPTKTHNTYDKMSAIAFHPGDPSILYLGLDTEQGF
jgi:photosystem II stability/assembly factor-like uncharacterized protein